VGGGPAAFGDSHDHVAGFFEGGGAGVDDEAGTLDQGGVEFALGREAGADGDYVGAVTDPIALNDRVRRRGDRDYDIGAAYNGFGVGHGARPGFGCEFAQAGWVWAPGADFGELAYLTERFVMAAGLDSGAENSEDTCVFSGEVPG